MRAFSLLILSCSFCLVLSQAGHSAGHESHMVIFHTTDTHGHIVTGPKTIGLDLVAGIVRQTPGALLVDCGDFLMGLAPAAMTKGKAVISIMKTAGYFAAAVGNHEFDYGPDELLARYAEATAAPNPMYLLSANTRGKNGKLLVPAEAETVVDGVKICFFGLTTQQSKFAVSPAHIKDINFEDPLETARRTAAKQRAAGCDLVVALSHLGSRKEKVDDLKSAAPLNGKRKYFTTSRELATVPGIDLILDGHSHVAVNEQAYRGPLLASAGAHGKNLGRVDIFYDKKSKKITRMGNTLINRDQAGRYAPDAAVKAELADLTTGLDKRLSRFIGRVEHSLNGSEMVLRTMEAPLGNLFADALRSAIVCDMALLNAGGLRAGLKKGDVTLGDIVNVAPFRGQIVTLRVTGREIRELLEFGFSSLPEPSGAFPQVSGLIVHLAPERLPGERILSITLENGNPIDPDKQYILAVNDFVAGGGDGYPVLATKPSISAGKSLQEAAVEFLGKNSTESYKNAPARRIIFLKR